MSIKLKYLSELQWAVSLTILPLITKDIADTFFWHIISANNVYLVWFVVCFPVVDMDIVSQVFQYDCFTCISKKKIKATIQHFTSMDIFVVYWTFY